MNPRKSLIVISVVTILTLIGLTFYGCGSDSSRPTMSYGSNSEASFVAVNSEVHSLVDSTLKFIQAGFEAMSAVPSADIYVPDTSGVPDADIQVRYGPRQGDSVTASYRYINGWHILTFADNIAGKAVDFKDSIRFRDELSTPIQEPDGLTSMIYKHRWSVRNNDTAVTHSDLAGDIAYTITDLNSTLATFTGKTSWQADHKLVTADSTVWTSVTISANASNLQVLKTSPGWLQSCPTNGSIIATVTLVRQKDSATPATSEWNITISFNDGHTYVKYVSGNVVWLSDWQACTAPMN